MFDQRIGASAARGGIALAPARCYVEAMEAMDYSLHLSRLSDTLCDMKTVTLRTLRRESAILDRAAAGEEVVVTRFGKPYIRILPVQQPTSFLGAGKHLGVDRPVSPERIPAKEWKGLS